MKKLFLSLVALTMATMSYAQSSVLATLSHEGEISTFYGAGALKRAHAAAKHGDVITLSSGSFQAVDITKAVTIRGAGMQVDTIAKIYPSVIVGNYVINVADTLEQHLTMEGVYCDDNTVTVYNNLKNATFIKSRFYIFKSVYGETNGYGFMSNLAFIHCKIAKHFNNRNGGNTVSFVNSVIMNPSVGKNDFTNNSFEFTNCVIRWDGSIYGDYPSNSSHYAIYRNCILSSTTYSASYYHSLSDTNLIYNCLEICKYNMFADFGSQGVLFYHASNISDVFKNWGGTYYDTQSFKLTDEAKTKYLGDDGKELGIYGGNLPFTPNPTNPKITKFNVASKSTADGKLSVDIEVKAAE